jgi:hypothetical protein
MPIAAGIVGAGVSAVGTALAAGQQADAQRQASQTAQQGFNYLRSSPVGTQYLPAGGAANAAQAQLLLGTSGGVDEAATKTNILTALKQNVGKGYDQAFVNNIEQQINSGVPLGQITAQIQQLASTTTHKSNQPAISAIMGAVNNPVTQQAGGGDAFQNYLNSTGYKFQLEEGQKAVTTNAATRGVLNSGATLKALTQYGQNLASTTFNNYLNQLGSLAGQGIQAGQLVGGAAQGAGTQTAAYQAGAGEARGAGTAGAAGIVGGGVSNALSNINFTQPRTQPYPLVSGVDY